MPAGHKRLKLAALISGNGSNLQALIDACANPDFPAQIVAVISNKPDAYGLQRAKSANIPTHIINHKDFENRERFDAQLVELLSPHQPDLICLAGFMRILTPVFIDAFAGKILNTHPSLLPKFGGEGMHGNHVHQAVLAAQETQSGCSIHEVTIDVDQGPVICQKNVPVHPDDTVDSLAARVLAQEHLAYPQAIELIAKRFL